MAVINNYVDANLVLGKISDAAVVSGAQVRKAVQSFAIGAADAAGSVYRVFKGLSPDIIVTKIEMYADAITGGTSLSVGAYTPLDYDGVGAAIAAACFTSALDVSAGAAVTGAPINLMQAVSIANREKQVWALVGDAQYPAKHPAWDLGLLFTNLTTGGGLANITVAMEYIQG